MNRRGFVLAAGFLFLAVTVLFIVNVHLSQMQFQSLSMSRSTQMDNLHYQRVNEVQSFWQVARRVFESYGGLEPTEIPPRFNAAIRKWSGLQPEGLQYGVEDHLSSNFSSFSDGSGRGGATAASAWFGLEAGHFIIGEVSAAGGSDSYKITGNKEVLVTSECPAARMDAKNGTVICAEK